MKICEWNRFDRLVDRLIVGFILLVTAPLALRAAGAKGSQVVWRIGHFDRSSTGFHSGSMPTPAPVYVIGKSRPDKDWYAFQPDTANAGAGGRPHPVTIRFDLKGTPKGLYTLKVGMLAQSRRLSILKVNLNGHRGWVYQRPQWHDVPGDKYYKDLATVQLPTRDFHAGTNNLVLTAIDRLSQPDAVSNPGISYDALELDQNTSQKFEPNAISADVHPTIFYQRKNGTLVELVDVYTSQNGPSSKGTVTLWVNKQKFTEPLSPDRDFGQQRIEFAVPAFAAGAGSRLLVNLGRARRRFSLTLDPAKKWTIYVVPNEHLDVGYTDYQSKVAEIHSRVVDEVLHMIQENPQFKYSPDGFWVLQKFLEAISKPHGSC